MMHMAMSESREPIFQDTLRRIVANLERHKHVVGVVICDDQGLPLHSNMDAVRAEEISAQIASLVGKIYHVTKEIASDAPQTIRLEFANKDFDIIPDVSTGVVIIALVDKKKRILH